MLASLGGLCKKRLFLLLGKEKSDLLRQVAIPERLAPSIRNFIEDFLEQLLDMFGPNTVSQVHIYKLTNSILLVLSHEPFDQAPSVSA